MGITRRVFVSMPADEWLAPNQNELKWGIVEEIEKLGYPAEIFFDPRGKPGLAAAKAWSAREPDIVMRRCVGAAVIGMPRWVFSTSQGDVHLPTEFCHYEGAIAYTLRLPMLVLVQADVLRRVVFDNSYDGYVGVFQPTAGRAWVHTSGFRVPFGHWKHSLDQRCDIFLGYCGSSTTTAAKVKDYLQGTLGVTVLDWQTGFAPGRSILEQIAEAASRCSAGIFLFTNDDKTTNGDHKDRGICLA
jgi:hypothetical protein